MGSSVTSKEIRAEEAASYPGMSHYRIFHKEGKKQVADTYFWCITDEDAHHMLIAWQKKNGKPNVEYFYGTALNFISEQDDGTEIAYDTMEEMHEAWRHERDNSDIEKFVDEEVKHENQVISDFKQFVDNYDPRHGVPEVKQAKGQAKDDPCDKAEAVYSDFKYFFDHYDSMSSLSHQRAESWSLDNFLLEALRFNLPVLIKKKHGVPNEYCVEAIKQMHKNDPNFDVDTWYAAHNYSCAGAEFKLAKKLWNAELKKLLIAVKTYDYYMDYGQPNVKNDKIMQQVKKKLDKTFPYKPGTDHEIDYTALSKLSDAAWNDIWSIWTKIGRNCWD